MLFDMIQQYTMSKKGVREVPIHSSAAEKRLTVTLTCTGNGDMLPAMIIFKGKRKLKFKPPKDVSDCPTKRLDGLQFNDHLV